MTLTCRALLSDTPRSISRHAAAVRSPQGGRYRLACRSCLMPDSHDSQSWQGGSAVEVVVIKTVTINGAESRS